MKNDSSLDIYCLDPSCFTSLGRLKDLSNALYAIKEIAGNFVIYLPKMVHQAIMLEPEEKFRVLPPLISEWTDQHEDETITTLV